MGWNFHPMWVSELKEYPLHFQTGSCRRQLSLALVFLFILCSSTVFQMNVLFCCITFSFSGSIQDINWEEPLRNDPFCVE